eukprot:CAMPEP_0176503534 /NCGR_PEP_ID=MMETSP0200_2-20121128/15416_1 /TAXON_ID=947934 /ORGANISM="Chaetoceros sp., Strain GSL56" /LENGTH=404 /DNA_ID=CAMNT_0017902835 /DNA_START=510 /DNA_END=1721 /DNA_ORIENTATION=-
MVTDSGEVIEYMECHEWYALGGCEDTGKQNDWIFHNSVLDYILEYYKSVATHVTNIILWSDNCPGQYKCRQNFFQIAQITNKHPHINSFTHNFAKQFGFKSKNDTIGHWIKSKIRQQERDMDCFAPSALACFDLVRNYLNKNPSHFENMIMNKDPRVRLKSPHAATKRFIVYVEDSKTGYDNLISQYSSFEGSHFVYTNRSYMQANEDSCAVKDTSKFYQFCHLREKDIYDIQDFPPRNVSDNGVFTCCVCSKQYKANAAFKIHEEKCKLAISSKMAHSIEYREAPCYCKQCINGSWCQFSITTGKLKTLWMVSLQNQKDIQVSIWEDEQLRKFQEKLELAKEAIDTLQKKYHPIDSLADIEFEQKEIRVEQYQAISCILGLRVLRGDGRNTNPRKADYVDSLK